MVTVLRSADPAPDAPAESPAERGYYNVSEAARVLGVSRMTISRWIRSGRLPAARLGHRTVRIRHDDLDQLLLEARVRHRPNRGCSGTGGDGTAVDDATPRYPQGGMRPATTTAPPSTSSSSMRPTRSSWTRWRASLARPCAMARP